MKVKMKMKMKTNGGQNSVVGGRRADDGSLRSVVGVGSTSIGKGDHPGQENKVRLLDSARLLPVVVETDSQVEAYLEHRLMPCNNLADARHLAVATYHRCDFLLTWNCRHLANGNKLRHLRKINEGLGLPSPDLVRPLELMEDSP